MYNTDIPNREELPSTAKLVRSTIIAAIVALVLLVTVVMPAEYALDPTGAGRLLGLTEMGEIKEQLAEEAAADEAAQMVAVQSSVDQKTPEVKEPVVDEAVEEPSPSPEVEVAPAEPAPEPEIAEPQWQDEVRVVLTPGEGTEFKLTMEKGATARFSWVSEGGPINFDTHGDGGGQSISYEKGRGVPEDEGELVAAFTGNHGWFFRNRNDNNITLVLRTGGDYGELRRAL
ncbi:hypothetical protein [Marinobacter salarius]|jgi:hypothetical protein|uniref:hypothetical protein n=1 Tax=Marinobacter salarius TaxID=1420917 RepID=UPI0018F25057|nr:hypothetical protein [Marinobacter salarius]MBJ7301467.1 hypothetical protein [Marinobacter salarius]HIO29627.1 hypothetical protein [Marinobacter salarius]HIP00742.1 hypothetical protein [Marinobacter salarius]